MFKQIINIAGYQFINIDDIQQMCKQVQGVCDQTHLKGTVFISPEGINLSLAGVSSDIEFVIDQLNSVCGFNHLLLNETYSTTIPFKRLLVKARDELVPSSGAQIFSHQDLNNPTYIISDELKQWLDDNKDFTLLDLRNGFEYALGSFNQAQHLGLKHFREFENSYSKLENTPKDKPLVTFCTGGIRCEKGAAFIARLGFDRVYQLKGGLLDYLAKFQNSHWHGDCFVFDERVSLDSQLKPTYAKLCRSCQTLLLTNEERFCSACASMI